MLNRRMVSNSEMYLVPSHIGAAVPQKLPLQIRTMRSKKKKKKLETLEQCLKSVLGVFIAVRMCLTLNRFQTLFWCLT